MERVQLNSSSSYETESGLCAVVPSRVAMVDELRNVNIFEFRTSPFGSVVRVEWPIDSDVALLPTDVASAMTTHGWARNLTESEADAYNAAVAAFILSTTGEAPGEPEPVEALGEPGSPPVEAPGEPGSSPVEESASGDGMAVVGAPTDVAPANPFAALRKSGKR